MTMTKYFTLCSIYRSNQTLWKIQGIVKMKLKISSEIMWCQGYFLKDCSEDKVEKKRKRQAAVPGCTLDYLF